MNNLNNLPVELQIEVVKKVIDSECEAGFKKICPINRHFRNV